MYARRPVLDRAGGTGDSALALNRLAHRDLAIKFNNQYGDVFKIPEAFIPDSVAIVPGTDGQKMSKSYGNTIPLFSGEKELKKAVMNIVTDCKGLEEKKDPDSCNVFKLYQLFATNEEIAKMRENYLGGNYGYGHAKLALFEKIWTTFAPMRARRAELAADWPGVADLLRRNGEKARQEAAITLDRVRRAVGLN